MKCGGLREMVDDAICAAVRRANKAKTKFHQVPDLGAITRPDTTLGITQASLDAAWIAAGCETTIIIRLDEMELEIARFVSSALVQLYTNATTSTSFPTTSKDCRSILSLQQNELPHTLRRPYILPTHIRVFQFLRTALWHIAEMRPYISLDTSGNCWVRKILARDAGNSFGIWEQTQETKKNEDGEMFGWGIWVDASFFNHSRLSLSRPPIFFGINSWLNQIARQIFLKRVWGALFTSRPTEPSLPGRNFVLAMSM